MGETVTINRITYCPVADREVAQQISAYTISEQKGKDKHKSELLTKQCSAQDLCQSQDCQFIIGLSGKAYTKTLTGIYQFVDSI